MSTEAKRRPGGARPNGPLLERDQIIDEATALTGEAGLANLSMRQLGDRLDVTSMAIYWYVRNRKELVDAVADRVASLIPIPDDDLPWAAWLRQSCIDTHRVMIGYPGIADHILSASDTPPEMVDRQRRSIATLERAGLSTDAAITSITVLGTFVLARAQLDAHHRLSGADAASLAASERLLLAGVDQILAGVPLDQG